MTALILEAVVITVSRINEVNGVIKFAVSDILNDAITGLLVE